jgi:hypothetical protein
MVLAPPIGGVDRNDGYLVTYSATYSIVYADTIPAEGSCGEYGELGACELERCKEVRQGWAVKKSGGWEQIVTVLPYDVESALFFGLAHASKVIREEYFCESEPATIARTCPPGHVCNSYRLDTGYESYSDGFVRSAWDFYTGWGEYPFGQAWIYGGGEYRDYGGLPGDYSGTATGACGTGTGVVNARQFKGGKLIGRDVVLKTWSESNDDGPWPEIWDFNEVAPIVVPKVIQSAGGEALFDDTPTTSVRPEGLAELEVRALIPIGGV